MRILIIGPEKNTSESLHTLLSQEGYTVESLPDCDLACDYISLGIYDLMILNQVPSSKDLLSCVATLLQQGHAQQRDLSFGNTTLNLSSGTLHNGTYAVRLSAKEYDMMRLFLQNPSHNLSKEMLLSYVWGYDSNATENHVEVYISSLRKKLVEIHSDISIVNIRKLGYHLELR